MRYFLTGATGFIGGRLARRLRDDGHDVVALVRDFGRAGDLVSIGVELARGDVTDRESLRTPLAGVDGLFHVAAWYHVGEGERARARAVAVNVEGTRNVLEAMRDAGVSKGVYTSTLAIYSDTHGAVPDETYRFEGRHLSVYDETKARAHYDVALPMMTAGLPLVVVQPGMVYGPGDTSQMGELMRRYAAGRTVVVPGGVAFSWAHVDDVVQAHILAMEKGATGACYHVGGPRHTLSEALAMLSVITGRRPATLRVPPGLSRAIAPAAAIIERLVPLPADYSSETLRVTAGTTYLGDNSRARRELGYEARPLRQGLLDTFGTSSGEA